MNTLKQVIIALLMLISIEGFGFGSAGPDQAQCLNFSNTTITMAATGTGTWTALPNNPTTTSITNPISPTTTMVGFTSPGIYGFSWGTTVQDTMYVTIHPMPAFYFSVGGECPGHDSIVLVPNGLLPTDSIVWMRSYTTVGTGHGDHPVYYPTATGTYEAKGISSFGCIYPAGWDSVYIPASVVPSVGISVSKSIICSGYADTFTAAPTHGGSAPSYQWYKNGIAVGTNDSVYITSALADNDSVSVIMTSNSPCAVPATAGSYIIISVNPSPPAPALSVSGSCLGSDTLLLRGTSGLLNIDWYRNGSLVAVDSQRISTVAGGNGAGSAANQLHYPGALYVDGSGNIYVADEQNNRIQKFPAGSTSATNAVTVAGGNGAGSAANQLSDPVCVVVDAAGNIYVADAGNNRVQKFPAGSTSATNGVTVAGGHGAGVAANQLSFPLSICLDAGGNLYVGDQDNLRIQKFPAGSTSATNGTTVAGGNGNGNAANQFADLGGICTDAAGNLYVSDLNNYRIQKFPSGSTAATNGTTVAGGNGQGYRANQLAQTVQVYVDAAGAIYVADENGRIQKFPAGSTSASSAITVAAGQGYGSAPNQISYPTGLYLDAAQNIYITDGGNHRVQKWSALPIDSSYIPAAAGSYTAVSTISYGCSSPVSAAMLISVCAPDTVWPGDADRNKFVDNADLLTIGLGYDSTGPARTVTGDLWQADLATDWSQNFSIYAPAVNFVNADCNGDGLINAADTLAIVTNFGDAHAKTNGYNSTWRSGIPGLRIALSLDTVLNAQTLSTDIYLGDSALPVGGIYGLAFTLNYDPIIVDSTIANFAFVPSWLGSAGNSININKTFFGTGEVKAAITGINHIPRGGYGKIATFTAVITTGNINGKDLSYYTNLEYISDITAIDQLGNRIQLNAGIDSNYIGYYSIVGIHDADQKAKVNIYPNPANTLVHITSSAPMSEISITDILGQNVLVAPVSNRTTKTLDLSILPSGVYMIHVSTAYGSSTSKLVINR